MTDNSAVHIQYAGGVGVAPWDGPLGDWVAGRDHRLRASFLHQAPSISMDQRASLPLAEPA